MKKLTFILIFTVLAAPASFAENAVTAKISNPVVSSSQETSQSKIKIAKSKKEQIIGWSEDERVLFSPSE